MALVNGSLVGRRVERVGRVYYVHDGQTSIGDGAVEIGFSDGSVRRYEVAGNGEGLRIEDTPWLDPFAEPLDAVNREYVRDVGKWTAFDVSDEEPYSQICGSTVTAVEEITNERGVIIGVLIGTDLGRLAAKVGADELWVVVT
ncbi:MAG: hypothetical protein ABI301_04940 [Jatrophihabitantaceae bacterium]